MKKILCVFLSILMCLTLLCSCSKAEEKTVVIYSCANTDRIAELTAELQQKFPDYTFIVEYQSTSKLGSKLLAEGENTDCDIIHDLSYLTLDALDEKSLLAELTDYDRSVYVDGIADKSTYLPEVRTGGAVIINTKVLAEKGLAKPTSYQDLLKPEYKGLISMPDPNSSGTGYMFFKSLVNAWGEKEAVEYFKKLSENVLQFTESGNGPVNALIQEEVAIGLGMITNAVKAINDDNSPFEILVFEEGAPYSMYGQAIVKGKETNPYVKEVFDYLVNECTVKSCEKWAPEKIYKDVDFTAPNFPTNIKYADMRNDTTAEKERLLKLWPVV